MKINIYFFFLIILIGCSTPETPEIVISKAIKKIELANTISYNVQTTFKKAFEKDTLINTTEFLFKRTEYEPYIGFHFSKKESDSFHMVYETLKLFNINKKEKSLTEYSFKNDANVAILYKHGSNQESLPGVLKVLKEFQNEKTIAFKGKEKINNRLTYFYTATSKKNITNIVNYFWIDAKTYEVVKLKTIQTLFKNNKPDYTFYICYFSNINFDQQINDQNFKPSYDETFTKVFNEFDPENPTLLSSGNEAPSLRLKDLEGNMFEYDYTDKFTFLKFWESSSEKCIKSIPVMKKLIARFNKKINFITINMDENISDTKTKMNENGIQYPVYLGSEEVKSNYEIQVYPSYFIIDHQGNIIYSNYGNLVDNEFELVTLLNNLK